MLQSLGMEEPALAVVARGAYDLLGLQSYFTAGEKEIRAWTIRKGDTAPKAAGVIHGDFERGFIRAECFSIEDLEQYRNEKSIREAGKPAARARSTSSRTATSSTSSSTSGARRTWPRPEPPNPDVPPGVRTGIPTECWTRSSREETGVRSRPGCLHAHLVDIPSGDRACVGSTSSLPWPSPGASRPRWPRHHRAPSTTPTSSTSSSRPTSMPFPPGRW